MEEKKEVTRSDLGIITDILNERGGTYKTELWSSPGRDSTDYKVKNLNGQMTYVIRQYDKPKLEGGLEIKYWALNQKELSDELRKHSSSFGVVLAVKWLEREDEDNEIEHIVDLN